MLWIISSTHVFVVFCYSHNPCYNVSYTCVCHIQLFKCTCVSCEDYQKLTIKPTCTIHYAPK